MKKSIIILLRDVCDEWVELAKRAKLNTLGLHFIITENDVQSYLDWLDNGGREFVAKLENEGIEVEHELHAVSHLLPRGLFETHPEYFRVENGERNGDYNFCCSNEDAIAIVTENTYKLAKQLRQKGHKYYFWLDDKPNKFCSCEKCKDISYSDQTLRIVEAMLKGLRQYDEKAELCYLAYESSIEPPTKPIPDGVFLEFAAIHREMDKPMTHENNAQWKAALEKLLEVFPKENAEILEYWLDESWYAQWDRSKIDRVPYDENLLKADFEYYTSLGVSAIKTFGAYMDKTYLGKYGDKEIVDYGNLLESCIKSK